MSADTTELEAEILAYLSAHPNAMDSIEGIAKWWLERKRVSVDDRMLSRAVSRLVECGALEVVESVNAALYRLGRRGSYQTRH